jgi:hypothetical protein
MRNKDPYYFKRLYIKITHWEYWPFHVIYFPIYFYWAWLMLKARAVFFFNAANPSIENGGFLMESKKKIYDLLPSHFYPTTLLFEPGVGTKTVLAEIIRVGIDFPFIAKPDIGMRGMQVKLISNEIELNAYLLQSKVPFLIQSYITYTEEAGIFYCKIPGEKLGTITGIVGKEFVTITGDGKSSIREILIQNNRYLLQLPTLEKNEGSLLHKILEAGEKYTLVPYGNHARGSRFIDWSDRIDDTLQETFHKICLEIPEFYYGRIDIRFRDWESFKAGKDFYIIEVNGAGSDPTHIYDPSHSIIFAWKEIIKHLNLLYKISILNKKLKGLHFMRFSDGMKMMRANAQHVAIISAN